MAGLYQALQQPAQPAQQGSVAQALSGAFGGGQPSAPAQAPIDNRAMPTPNGAYDRANAIMDAYNKGPEAVQALKVSNPEFFK